MSHSLPAARLPRQFYAQPTLQAARALLGARLVRRLDGLRLAGIIVETEAYIGEDDLGCHARAGRTPRTALMYGAPGHAYIYFTYGMHWLLNCVCEAEGFPAAVLLRAILPVEGVELMRARRAKAQHLPPARWTDGPAKICQALSLTGAHNGLDLCDPAGELWIEVGENLPDSSVTFGARVGLNTVPEPWRSLPWRLRVAPQALPGLMPPG